MKVTSQSHFLNSIVEVLIHNLAYYLPREIIPKNVLIELKGKIPPNFFDDLSILDIYHGIGEFDVLEFNERLAKKRQQLEKTIFELIEKRKGLEEYEFQYILDKYFRQVQFYLAISNWFRLNTTNYKRINKQFDLITKGSFEFQFEAYKFHVMELINWFYKGKELNIKESFTSEEIVKYYLQEFLTRFQHAEEVIEIDQPTKENQQEQLAETLENQTSILNTKKGVKVDNLKQQTTTKKKKRAMVTEQEAQDFLLTSVFNVDSTILIK